MTRKRKLYSIYKLHIWGGVFCKTWLKNLTDSEERRIVFDNNSLKKEYPDAKWVDRGLTNIY